MRYRRYLDEAGQLAVLNETIQFRPRRAGSTDKRGFVAPCSDVLAAVITPRRRLDRYRLLELHFTGERVETFRLRRCDGDALASELERHGLAPVSGGVDIRGVTSGHALIFLAIVLVTALTWRIFTGSFGFFAGAGVNVGIGLAICVACVFMVKLVIGLANRAWRWSRRPRGPSKEGWRPWCASHRSSGRPGTDVRRLGHLLPRSARPYRYCGTDNPTHAFAHREPSVPSGPGGMKVDTDVAEPGPPLPTMTSFRLSVWATRQASTSPHGGLCLAPSRPTSAGRRELHTAGGSKRSIFRRSRRLDQHTQVACRILDPLPD